MTDRDTEKSGIIIPKTQITRWRDSARDAAFGRAHGDKKAWQIRNRHLLLKEAAAEYKRLAIEAHDLEEEAKRKHNASFMEGIAIARGD